MIQHPLLLTLFATDVVVVLLLAGAAVSAFRIALGWQPQGATANQLRLEARWETASLAAGWATALALAATFALMYAVTNRLPGLVPGAMCGAGVFESMQTAGPRLLIYRLLAVGTLWLWWRVEKASRSLPEAHFVPASARIFLLALPMAALSLHATWQAVLTMELQQPVDCCAVIYDHFGSLDDARLTLGAGRTVWLTSFGIASAASTLGALAAWRHPLRRRLLLLILLSAVWLPVAAIALIRFLTPYHYGVLHHHCPWCLFLPEHHLVGFPIWGAWLLVLMEAPAGLVVLLFGRGRRSAVIQAVSVQAGQAARNTLLAIALFGVLAIGPALWWRFSFGVWVPA